MHSQMMPKYLEVRRPFLIGHGVLDARYGDHSRDHRTNTLTRVHYGFEMSQVRCAVPLQRDICYVGLGNGNDAIKQTCDTTHCNEKRNTICSEAHKIAYQLAEIRGITNAQSKK